ncbi:MAG: hypothetical protein ACI4W2_02860 [Eubacterium sp.]
MEMFSESLNARPKSGTFSNSMLRSKINVPETAVSEAKRKVNVLHVFADEDHVHMQKAGKKPGKRSRIVPLVTVKEGICSIGTHREKYAEYADSSRNHLEICQQKLPLHLDTIENMRGL